MLPRWLAVVALALGLAIWGEAVARDPRGRRSATRARAVRVAVAAPVDAGPPDTGEPPAPGELVLGGVTWCNASETPIHLSLTADYGFPTAILEHTPPSSIWMRVNWPNQESMNAYLVAVGWSQLTFCGGAWNTEELQHQAWPPIEGTVPAMGGG